MSGKAQLLSGRGDALLGTTATGEGIRAFVALCGGRDEPLRSGSFYLFRYPKKSQGLPLGHCNDCCPANAIAARRWEDDGAFTNVQHQNTQINFSQTGESVYLRRCDKAIPRDRNLQ